VAPGRFSATETLDIGMDLGSTVTPAYREQAPFAFTGTVKEVKIEVAPTQPIAEEGGKRQGRLVPLVFPFSLAD